MTGRQLLNTELDTWIGPYLPSGTRVAFVDSGICLLCKRCKKLFQSLTGGSTNFEKCPGCPDPNVPGGHRLEQVEPNHPAVHAQSPLDELHLEDTTACHHQLIDSSGLKDEIYMQLYAEKK